MRAVGRRGRRSAPGGHRSDHPRDRHPAGRLEWAPTLDWRDVTLGETARTRFDVAVYVENDANAAALAEEQLREASEGDNLLFLLLDSGVGAGLLVDRQLYRGGAGRVGESGHIRLPAADGSTGATVEEVIGRQAVLRAYRSDAGRDATWEDLARRGRSWRTHG